MHLKKLEIQGFKSFATKNKLVFSGFLDKTKRGFTVIVGPNGSGKSNIADAIRWVLGEQSMRNIRAKTGSDVIFCGSEKRGRHNMAEVSLYLDNTAGRVDIPYSELILTRRVFRNGENEYLINNSRTRLSDIQLLLAKANFGQKTYSVIGQGTVEQFLDNTPKERKLFFDEATGIKKFQIKREESLNKLLNSHKNLDQANLIINEIEPRLKLLTRQVGKLKKEQELRRELKDLQTKYFQIKWHKLNDKFNKLNQNFLHLEEEKIKKEEKLYSLNNEFNKIQEEDSMSKQFNILSEDIAELQKKHEAVIKKITILKTKRELSLEYQGKFDISWLEIKGKDLKKKIGENIDNIDKIEEFIKNKKNNLENIKKEKKDIVDKIKRLNNGLFDLVAPKKQQNTTNNEILNQLKNINNIIKNSRDEQDIKKIFSFISKIKTKISILLKLVKNDKQKNSINIAKNKQKYIKESIDKKTAILQKISSKYNNVVVKINSFKERRNILNNNINNLQSELKNIENKIKKYSLSKNTEKKLALLEDDVNKQKLEKALIDIDKKIGEKRKKLNQINSIEIKKRRKLSNIQQKSQEIQKSINEINNVLNNTKIESTKYETMLENIENDIRNSFVENLSVIKNNRSSENDWHVIEFKIDKINKELGIIGSIEPEIENEYYQVKEKYDFLNSQVIDLNKAIKALESVIRELDTNIKQKFNKKFNKISEKFEKYFKILFNGGNAKIIKINTNKNNLEDNNSIKNIKKLSKMKSNSIDGIDIYASPPGKKISSLSVLSGGEKALTVIALICAIINTNPSPFVFLDEVDAALDEANSQRLVQILEDLSNKTQFITITHNRASMHKADILYGVTMGSDGVSKLLSLKLDSAIKYSK